MSDRLDDDYDADRDPPSGVTATDVLGLVAVTTFLAAVAVTAYFATVAFG